MAKVKAERIAGIIKKEISQIIQFELKDPKVGFVTITDVTITNDLSLAKVYVSFLGKSEREEAGLKALNRSKGFIRSTLAKRLTIRKTPEIQFFIDDALERGNKIDNILEKIHSENK